MRRPAFVLLTAIALVAPACGAEPSAPTTRAFVVHVREEGLFRGDDDRPLAGAAVTLDLPDGRRATATSDGSGEARLDVAASIAAVTVTAFSSAHTLVTILEASVTDAPVLVLPRIDAAIRDASIELRGSISGKRDAGTTIDLSASGLRRLGSVTTTEPSYAMRAPRDRAFFLLGHEIVPRDDGTSDLLGSFRIDVAARAADSILDVDLGAAPRLPTRSVNVRIELPPGPDTPFGEGTKATAAVLGVDSQLLVGALREAAPSADRRARDLELAVADVDVAPERIETRATLIAEDGSRSMRTEPGVVPDGTAWTDFLLPPRVTEASRSVVDPIVLERFPAGADLRIEAYAGGKLFWIVRGPRGGPRDATVRLPHPHGVPFTADVQLFALTFAAETEDRRRVAISRDVLVRRR